ncbi:cystatin-B-like [Psammomys obesus]|uniref:cystatin-B-like n=1 Tax=Psammomys obesus TaxID=48139 RepID=UPI0024531C79|nr:cystatin-B-like [Psammomys obesus]
MMCGTPSAMMLAMAESQEIAHKVKTQLEEKENQKFDLFKAVSFKKQIVAGLNIFIKVDVGDDKYVHLRVFEALPHENKPLTLSSYQTNKEKHDELTYL